MAIKDNLAILRFLIERPPSVKDKLSQLLGRKGVVMARNHNTLPSNWVHAFSITNLTPEEFSNKLGDIIKHWIRNWVDWNVIKGVYRTEVLIRIVFLAQETREWFQLEMVLWILLSIKENKETTIFLSEVRIQRQVRGKEPTLKLECC